MRPFKEGATMQVAMVVRDMDAAMKRHWDVFKIGPWDIYEFDAAEGSELHVSRQARDPCLPDRGDLERRHPARAHAAAHRLQHL